MQLSQIPKVAATFDGVNLVPSAALVPVMRLARLAGLESLVTRKVTLHTATGDPDPAGAANQPTRHVTPRWAGAKPR